MPNLIPAKTLKPLMSTFAAVLAAGLSFTPLAVAGPKKVQNDTPVAEKERLPDAGETPDLTPTQADYFNAADFDNSGLLNRGEFELFVDTIASSGDSMAVTIRDNKSYAEAFTQVDQNGDDGLSLMELSPSKSESKAASIPNDD